MVFRSSRSIEGDVLINRLIPKYPTFMIIGIFIVAVGLFMLLASRDALIAVWINKFFDGETGDGLFKAAQQADQALGHTLSIWFFLGSAPRQSPATATLVPIKLSLPTTMTQV